MSIDFSQSRWDEVKNNAALWWEGKLGRPLIHAHVADREPDRSRPVLDKLTYAEIFDLSVPAADIVDYWDYELSRFSYLGDAFPCVWANLGPGILSTFLGAEPRYDDATVWFCFDGKDDISEISLKYDPDAKWLLRIKDIYRAAMERWEGLVQVSMTDLGGNLDIVSTFRPSEKLLLDLYDAPSEVKRLVWEAHEAWWQAFEDINSVLQPVNPGYTAWTPIFSQTPYYMLQCDFCYMIGPDMFDEFVKPELEESCNKLDHPFYHLDGPGQLAHLDSLVSIEQLSGVQWIPGEGAAPPEEWPEVYSRIHSAGKKTQTYSKKALDTVIAECGSAENVVLPKQNFKTRAEAHEFIERYS